MSRIQQLSTQEWDAMIAAIEADKQERAKAMPTEQDAIKAMFRAWERLKELGWREAVYAPQDGRMLEFIEAGSTGIHHGNKNGKHTWIHDAGDLWPSNPILFREPLPAAERIGLDRSPQDSPEQKNNPQQGGGAA